MAAVVMNFLRKWWMVLILGILSVILGFVLAANPGTGFEIARVMVVADYISIGILGVAMTIARRNEIPGWGWNLVGNILLLFMGFMVAVVPGMSQGLLITMFIFGFLLQGIAGIFGAVGMKKLGIRGWGWSLIFAILTVVLGIMLIINPVTAVISIDILVAAEMLSFGISMIILGIQMSKMKCAVDMAEKSIVKMVEQAEKDELK